MIDRSRPPHVSRRPFMPVLFICACVVVARTSDALAADDVFGIDVQPAGGAAIRSSGNELLPQLQDLIQNQGLFNALNGRAFTASLRYGEVGDALRITRNASGTSATVTSRLSGLNQTFNASD